MSKKAVKTLPCNCPIHKGKRLPVEKFSVNRSNKNRGYSYYCKEYTNEQARLKKKKKVSVKKNSSGNDPRGRLLSSARVRARDKNISFNITKKDIHIPNFCPVLGIPISVNNSGYCRDDSPSLDRIQPTQGYTKGNVRVVSHRANRFMSDQRADEAELVANAVKQR